MSEGPASQDDVLNSHTSLPSWLAPKVDNRALLLAQQPRLPARQDRLPAAALTSRSRERAAPLQLSRIPGAILPGIADVSAGLTVP